MSYPDPIPHPNRPPRYTDEPLPPYRFLPGVGRPHPIESPQGYLHRHEPPAVRTAIDVERWHELQEYLYGVDLFNLAYWWEAHEAWEELWHQTDSEILHQFIQGLIQLSAAQLKWHLNKPRGVYKLSHAAMRRLRQTHQQTASDHYMGLYLPDLLARVDRFFFFVDFDREEDREVEAFDLPEVDDLDFPLVLRLDFLEPDTGGSSSVMGV